MRLSCFVHVWGHFLLQNGLMECFLQSSQSILQINILFIKIFDFPAGKSFCFLILESFL